MGLKILGLGGPTLYSLKGLGSDHQHRDPAYQLCLCFRERKLQAPPLCSPPEPQSWVAAWSWSPGKSGLVLYSLFTGPRDFYRQSNLGNLCFLIPAFP